MDNIGRITRADVPAGLSGWVAEAVSGVMGVWKCSYNRHCGSRSCNWRIGGVSNSCKFELHV